MKPTYLKLGVRVFGTLVGMLGVAGICFTLALFLPHMIRFGGVAGGILAITGLLISVYELYVGYLVWFRWSPLAVQHVAAILSLLLWTGAMKYVIPRPSAGAPDWTMMLPMVSLAILYACYRWLTAHGGSAPAGATEFSPRRKPWERVPKRSKPRQGRKHTRVGLCGWARVFFLRPCRGCHVRRVLPTADAVG